MTLSTHVLDTARGLPAAGIAVILYAVDGTERRAVAHAETDADGRTGTPLGARLAAGTYEIVFYVADYFRRTKTATFYDEIGVRVALAEDDRSYHVPLLLAPWSYTTYRGS